jgi:hypothetical protein
MQQEIIILEVSLPTEATEKLRQSAMQGRKSLANRQLIDGLRARVLKAVFIVNQGDDGLVLPGDIDFRRPGVELIDATLETGKELRTFHLDPEMALKLAHEILKRFSPP